jgi:hypothetical protein
VVTEGARTLWEATLGQHRIALHGHSDGALSLILDGCERKRRGAGGGPAWLWTNVELPFEDHHLVEVRRGPDGIVITENGRALARLPSPEGTSRAGGGSGV